jgi:hypothetical protein
MSTNDSQRREPSWPRRHKVWTAFFAVLGVFAAFIIAGIVAGSPPPVGTPAAPATPASHSHQAAPAPAASSAPAAPRVIYTHSGSGDFTGPPLSLPGPVSVRYSFDCSAFGQACNFAGYLIGGTGASYDGQNFANQLALRGGDTATVYPQDSGTPYHLSVISEGSWTVTITST